MENIIISDLHLKEQDKDFFKDKREELIRERIKNIISKWYKRVFLNGDTFNESSVKNHWYVVTFFIEEILKPLLLNNIEIHILIWNHERFGKWNVFSFLEWELSNNLIFIHSTIEKQEFPDFNAIFIPFMYPWDRDVRTVIKLQEIIEDEIRKMVAELKNKSDKPVLIFNHNMMSDLPFDIGREMNIKFWEIPWVDFVIWWHIHKHEVFSVNWKDKWLYVWSFMKSFVYEEETEWFVEFDIDKNDKSIKYQYTSNTSFNYKKIDIDDTINFDDKTLEENTVYDINFYYSTQNADHNFISDILIKIKNKGSYVKNQKIIPKDSDVNLSKVISLLTDEKTILHNFLKDNEIDKVKHDDYYEKLDQCLWMIDLNKYQTIEKDEKFEEKVLENVKRANWLNNIINRTMSL